MSINLHKAKLLNISYKKYIIIDLATKVEVLNQMAKKMGEWAFIIGVLIAVVIGLFSGKLTGDTQGWLILVLVVLGLVVGFLNVTATESTPFLIAAAALLITGTTGGSLAIIPTIGTYLQGIVLSIAVFVTPAAIIVALKTIQSLAKD